MSPNLRNRLKYLVNHSVTYQNGKYVKLLPHIDTQKQNGSGNFSHGACDIRPITTKEELDEQFTATYISADFNHIVKLGELGAGTYNAVSAYACNQTEPVDASLGNTVKFIFRNTIKEFNKTKLNAEIKKFKKDNEKWQQKRQENENVHIIN